MLVTILSLTLCLTTVALFPVDIFMVSRIMDPTTGLRHEWATDAAIAEMQQSVQMTYAGMCAFLSGPSSVSIFLPILQWIFLFACNGRHHSNQQVQIIGYSAHPFSILPPFFHPDCNLLIHMNNSRLRPDSNVLLLLDPPGLLLL